ncbi:MAG: hypothetical protein A2Z35_05645 [Actinobacteria bacterium RBG_19FT_COMBO_36_27]|nr:MAG: hypothetical protein A2Z35_05645 [Actinobacteria bacterium RBG_19FT_COMBO_36_27]
MIKITRVIIFFVLIIRILPLSVKINYLYILILLNIIKNLWINTDYYAWPGPNFYSSQILFALFSSSDIAIILKVFVHI